MHFSLTSKLTALSLGALLFAPALAASSGCATTRMAGEQSDDARITGRVGRQLTADPRTKRARIDVDTIDRVVTLRGTAPTRASKAAAERVAWSVDGVTYVDNQLVVDSSKLSERASDSTRDAALKTKIGAKLAADPDIRRVNIDVDVEQRVAYLSGVVHDTLAREEAERLALTVDGVIGVQNELTVNYDDQRFSEDSEAY